MADFEFRFTDAFTFGKRMAAAPQIVSEELRSATDRLTLQGEALTKAETPVRTGHLRRSIAHKPAVFAGGTVTGSWGTATPYAPYVEEGRGPVVAGPGKVLRFVPKGSDRAIYRKRVGPAAGRHMFRKAVVRIRPMIGREYRAAAQRIIRRMGG